MNKKIVISAALASIAVVALFARDCRHPDETDVPADIGAAPDFYASSPKLLVAATRKLELSPSAADGDPKGAPFFIAFEDGAYVWGYTSEETGKTRPVFSDQNYTVYWYGEAEAQWLRRHPDGRVSNEGERDDGGQQ